MADKSTVQCNEDDKTFILGVAKRLDWSLPKLMALARRGLEVMVEGEESSDERADRMVAKLSNSATTLRNSKTPVRQESHGSATPAIGSREPVPSS